MKRKAKKLTVEQEAARDLRKARFNAICDQVKAMSKEEKLAWVQRAGAVMTVAGATLSDRNTILCWFQREGVTLVGGFRQWLAKGRCVRKGEHGLSILVPCGGRKEGVEGAQGEGQAITTSSDTERVFFVTGIVFDVSQTQAIDTESAIEAVPGVDEIAAKGEAAAIEVDCVEVAAQGVRENMLLQLTA